MTEKLHWLSNIFYSYCPICESNLSQCCRFLLVYAYIYNIKARLFTTYNLDCKPLRV